MKSFCYIRAYGELKKLLRKKGVDGNHKVEFFLTPTIKDIVESAGIPHTEVGLLLLNGESVGWRALVKNGDRIAAYPFFFSFDISKISKVYWKPPRIKFIADVHLGRLAKYLRILGFDCLYHNGFSDEEIIRISISEGRIILTMDRGILKNSLVKYGMLLKEKNVKKQIRDVIDRFGLEEKLRPFSRCLDCNVTLKKIGRREAAKVFEYLMDRYYKEFYRCPCCMKVYYKGSHYYRMLLRLSEFIGKDISC